MMAQAAQELVRAFLVVAPDVLGKKKTKRLLIALEERLWRITPANGVGPVIAARRDALMILQGAARLLSVAVEKE
jgi:hypothetical protein